MHSLSVYHKMTTKAIQSFLLRDASRYWQKLNSVFLRLLWFSTLSKQDTIYIKILLIQVQKNPTLLFFITKFVGGESLTFIFFFFLWYLTWDWEGTIFSKLVLRTKVSKQDDCHFLWITVHVKSWAVTLCKSNSRETNKNTCLHTEFCKNLCGEKKGKYT